jgi:hypothetical protein
MLTFHHQAMAVAYILAMPLGTQRFTKLKEM